MHYIVGNNLSNPVDKSELVEHKKIEHLECDKCTFKATRKSYFDVHILKEHLNKPNLSNLASKWNCEFCGFRTRSAAKLNDHREKCSIITTWYCSNCNDTFPNKQGLANHMESIHGKETGYMLRKCPHCEFHTNKNAMG